MARLVAPVSPVQLPARETSRNPPAPPHALEPRVMMAVTPNDPRFDEQWALREIGAPDTWAETTGSAAVIDGHGTHTAGVIGATGNNGVGVTGVAWKVRLMALKVFRDDGRGARDTDIAEAVRYAADNGARVSHNSYGGPGGRRGDRLYRAIHYAAGKGHLFIAAAGNQSRDND